MSKVHVTAKRDFLETLTNTKPLDGLAEIIWNGFDAAANHVQVFFELNDMDGIESIKVRDYGYGIDREKLKVTSVIWVRHGRRRSTVKMAGRFMEKMVRGDSKPSAWVS